MAFRDMSEIADNAHIKEGARQGFMPLSCYAGIIQRPDMPPIRPLTTQAMLLGDDMPPAGASGDYYFAKSDERRKTPPGADSPHLLFF